MRIINIFNRFYLFECNVEQQGTVDEFSIIYTELPPFQHGIVIIPLPVARLNVFIHALNYPVRNNRLDYGVKV